MATGSLFFGASLGMVCLSTAGLMFLHRRITALTGLQSRGQLLLAIGFAGPAVLLAITQIYPDLVSGVVLAAGLIELAIVERKRSISWLSSITVALAAALLPWLQVKNFAPAVILLAGWGAVTVGRGPWLRRVLTLAFPVMPWIVLLVYNMRHFGRLLGLPEPTPALTWTGVGYTLGLLFDRHQGLFIQLPFAVVGLLGMWYGRRRLRLSALATILALGSVLVLNGTYIVNPYGGGSFAGRFMWTAMPALIAWSAVAFRRWERAGRSLTAPILLAIVAWVYVAVPIADDEGNAYYNAFGSTPKGELAAWPGWWPGFNRLLPQFHIPRIRHFGAPVWATALEVLFLDSPWYWPGLRYGRIRSQKEARRARHASSCSAGSSRSGPCGDRGPSLRGHVQGHVVVGAVGHVGHSQSGIRAAGHGPTRSISACRQSWRRRPADLDRLLAGT